MPGVSANRLFRGKSRSMPQYNPDPKDEQRVQELVSKAMWVRENQIKLAVTMCKLITKWDKALRRGRAADEILGKHNIVSIIFYSRALELGCPEAYFN